MFSNQEREGIYSFVCALSLYVAETPKGSNKELGTPSPIIPFDNVAYGFVGQSFSKQLYTCNRILSPLFIFFHSAEWIMLNNNMIF